MHTVNVVLICCLLAVTSGCQKHAPRRSESQDVKPRDCLRSISRKDCEARAARFDVCGLLSKEEIHGVTGSSITQNLSSGRSDGSLRTSQCVYVANPANRSISLVVTQADSLDPRKRSPRDLWADRFGRYRGESKENKEEVDKEDEATRDLNKGLEEEREARPPRQISGLGEEAFWTAGSLYVLQKDIFLRLSIGGPEPEADKLEHSKALTKLVLKRL